jgi:hypothetical protein
MSRGEAAPSAFNDSPRVDKNSVHIEEHGMA